MKGVIDKVWDNQTKDGTPYRVLAIGGQKYSLWDSKYFEQALEGKDVEFEVKQSGDYLNITRLDSVGDGNTDGPSERDMRITRTSALKSATEIASGYRGSFDEVVERTLDLAKRFERYIKGDDLEHTNSPGDPFE